MAKKVTTQEASKKAPTTKDTMASLPKGKVVVSTMASDTLEGMPGERASKGSPKVEVPKVDPSIIAKVDALPIPIANKRTFIVGEGGQPKSIWIQAPKEDTDAVRIDLLKIQMGCKTQKDLGRALIDLAYKVHGITK